jgi:hypothetical protein
MIDVGILTHVDVMSTSYGSRRVDPGILLGVNSSSPDDVLVDIVGETVDQGYKELERDSVANNFPNIFVHLVPPAYVTYRKLLLLGNHKDRRTNNRSPQAQLVDDLYGRITYNLKRGDHEAPEICANRLAGLPGRARHLQEWSGIHKGDLTIAQPLEKESQGMRMECV